MPTSLGVYIKCPGTSYTYLQTTQILPSDTVASANKRDIMACAEWCAGRNAAAAGCLKWRTSEALQSQKRGVVG